LFFRIEHNARNKEGGGKGEEKKKENVSVLFPGKEKGKKGAGLACGSQVGKRAQGKRRGEEGLPLSTAFPWEARRERREKEDFDLWLARKRWLAEKQGKKKKGGKRTL